MALNQTAFVFPGQGTQHVGMASDLREAFASVRALFAEADDALGYRLSQIIRDGPEELLRKTANAQPGILLASVATYQILDLVPAVVAGHSLGEYSALVAAGAMNIGDALRLVHARGRYMQDAVPEGEGLMLALIGVETEAVREAIATATEPVDIANYNAPGQLVIAGARAATREVAERVGARRSVELAVSAPFHCRLMQQAEERLCEDLDRMPFADLATPLYTNVDARKITTAAEARDAVKRQVSRPVRWTELIQRMIAADAINTFVEVGPGKMLSGLVRRIDREVTRLAVNDRATVDAVRARLTG